MKHLIPKLLAITLSLALVVCTFGYADAYAAGYSAYAYSLNSNPEDSEEFIARIRAQSSNYTSSNSAVRTLGNVTQSSFTANTHNIKYWASEGNEYGEIWSNMSGNASFNLMDLNLKQK